MARATAALCALGLLGCSDGRYVIGRNAERDAAVVDGGVGECSGVHASAVLCSGFEPEQLTAEWTDDAIEGAGALERSTLRAHSGQASLHASTSDASSAAVLVQSFAAVRSGELHLRVHLYVPVGPTEIINLIYLGAAPGPDPFVGIDINLQDGAVQVFSPQASPSRQTGELQVPRQRWFCLRARVELRDEGGVVAVSVDDQLAIEATQIDTLPPGGLTDLRVGIDWSSAQEAPFEVYVDDVVLDTQPVDCLPP